jgi:hypothetical protein
VVRLVGLWTKPANVGAFQREYLGTHFPGLDKLENALDATISRCVDGAYFQMTEVSFTNLADMEAALETDFGKRLLNEAQDLADRHGVRCEVLVVEEPS